MNGERQRPAGRERARAEQRRALAEWLTALVGDLAGRLPAEHGPDGPGGQELAEIRAATLMGEVAQRAARERALEARSAGRSWAEIAAAWGIEHGPQHAMSRARRAFERLATWSAGAGPARVQWVCAACGHRVTDLGPDYHPGAGAGLHPRVQETQHGDRCPRMAAAVAAWQAAGGEIR